MQVFYKAKLLNTWYIDNTTTHSCLSSITKPESNLFLQQQSLTSTTQSSAKTNMKKKSGAKKNFQQNLVCCFSHNRENNNRPLFRKTQYKGSHLFHPISRSHRGATKLHDTSETGFTLHYFGYIMGADEAQLNPTSF